jgi:hypothetical protein
MAKQTFTTGQVLTAAQMTSLQQTAMGGGSATAKTASYTLVAADAGATVIMNSASATTITVNTSLFSAGDTVFLQNIGAGISTVTAGTATVNTSSSLALAQYESGTLYFTATGASIFSKAAGAAASGGSLTLLSTTTLSGASTTISSISQSYTHLYIYGYAIGSNAGNSGVSTTRIAPNGTTNSTNGLYTTSGSGWSLKLNDYLFISNMSLQGSAPTQNAFGMTIFNYSQTSGRKPFSSFGNGYIADTGESYPMCGIGGISTTSAITSLVFSNSAYDFSQGTILLYGVN